MTKNLEYKIYTDGGARGNPGPAGLGFVIYENGEVIEIGAAFLEHATNNEAEYKALALGLEKSIKLKIKEIDCYLDSELVVKQLNGEYKVKNPQIKIFFDKIVELQNKFEKITFTHVRREENKLADKLVNIAIDLKM